MEWKVPYLVLIHKDDRTELRNGDRHHLWSLYVVGRPLKQKVVQNVVILEHKGRRITENTHKLLLKNLAPEQSNYTSSDKMVNPHYHCCICARAALCYFPGHLALQVDLCLRTTVSAKDGGSEAGAPYIHSRSVHHVRQPCGGVSLLIQSGELEERCGI